MTEQTDAAEVLPWGMARAIADPEVARWLAAREAAAEVRGAQAVLAAAADALNVEAVGFQTGWGSNAIDQARLSGIQQCIDWLRARAAAAAAGGGGEG